jgi:4-amino-4-deoxychorismate lyase
MSTPSLFDRGFQFGDGLFETIRVEYGEVQQFDLHWQRLKRGAEVLGIRLPSRRILERRCQSLAKPSLPDEDASWPAVAALKLQITRGDTVGGYAAPETLPANVYLNIRPVALNPVFWQQGIRLRWCQQRLAIQPALAGLKHSNRLEQVLARREWQQDYQEGLMCDTEGYVVEGTASNLFICRDGEWFTPTLDRCGVAGTMRQQLINWLLGKGHTVTEQRLTVEQVAEAEQLLMCNAIIGLWPVAELEGVAKSLHPLTSEMLATLAPAMASAKDS